LVSLTFFGTTAFGGSTLTGAGSTLTGVDSTLTVGGSTLTGIGVGSTFTASDSLPVDN